MAAGASRNLWVSGLSSTTRATDLKTLFSKYGKVSPRFSSPHKYFSPVCFCSMFPLSIHAINNNCYLVCAAIRSAIHTSLRCKSNPVPPRGLLASQQDHLLPPCPPSLPLQVVGAKVVTNAKSPGARCYGFVTMSSCAEATSCITHLHRTELHGKMISVERVRPDGLHPQLHLIPLYPE